MLCQGLSSPYLTKGNQWLVPVCFAKPTKTAKTFRVTTLKAVCFMNKPIIMNTVHLCSERRKSQNLAFQCWLHIKII